MVTREKRTKKMEKDKLAIDTNNTLLAFVKLTITGMRRKFAQAHLTFNQS